MLGNVALQEFVNQEEHGSFLVCDIKHRFRRSVPSYQENRAHAGVASPLRN